jgi:hypothetical protein
VVVGASAASQGDPTNLVLWFATVLYLFVIEIPLYFPNIFGVEDALGVVFGHNTFTVQFVFDRLPLYIIALYPAVVTLAFEIVRSLGVFRERGIVVGAICVGFVHHCLYEVFDQLGPQLRWWAWNTENPLNHPMLASVPMTSVFIFATLGPSVVTLLVLLLVGRGAQRGRLFGGWSLTLRTGAAAILVPVGLSILSIPSSAFGGKDPNVTAQAIVFSVELALVALVAVPVLVQQWLRRADRDLSEFVRVLAALSISQCSRSCGSVPCRTTLVPSTESPATARRSATSATPRCASWWRRCASLRLLPSRRDQFQR